MYLGRWELRITCLGAGNTKTLMSKPDRTATLRLVILKTGGLPHDIKKHFNDVTVANLYGMEKGIAQDNGVEVEQKFHHFSIVTLYCQN